MKAMTSSIRKGKEVLTVEKFMDIMGCNIKKGKEVLSIDILVDLMGCRTEESLAAYQMKFAISEVDSTEMGGYKPSVDGDRNGDVGNVAMGGDSDDDGITQLWVIPYERCIFQNWWRYRCRLGDATQGHGQPDEKC
ncbi:hypothetical protein Syun_014759 [Stephania yunnanensis]|uniref:Uncharacterized protein n=1 Tax=Stephania yunnanensis TaxID=152371 RepID=A0AAP0P9X0_9MAGN